MMISIAFHDELMTDIFMMSFLLLFSMYMMMFSYCSHVHDDVLLLLLCLMITIPHLLLWVMMMSLLPTMYP